MKRSIAKLLMILNIILMIPCVIVAAVISDGSKFAMWGVGSIFIVISLIIGHFLRCPSCCRGQRNWLFAQYCPYCGEPLDDE